MAVSLTSPEDVINLALARIGYPRRIGSIYDGSLAARTALSIYGQTRDNLLRSAVWGFAKKTAALALSGQAAPSPWSFSYTYPADALKILDLIIAAPDPLNPLPVRWVIENDPVVGKAIMSSISYSQVVYISKVTNPAYWESEFIEALAASLGRRLAPVLMKEMIQGAAQDEEAMDKEAVAGNDE